MAEQNSQQLKGILPLLILKLLDQETDYGYSIVERLQSHGFNLNEGTVYPALNRMENNKELSSELVKSESGPARKYYQPTTKGYEELFELSQSWKELKSNVNSLLNESISKEIK